MFTYIQISQKVYSELDFLSYIRQVYRSILSSEIKYFYFRYRDSEIPEDFFL